MERIFPNLYRFSFGKKGRGHTCLLVRKQGNLLICHCNRGSSTDHLDEIERLGGIERQFLSHGHDARRGELHEVLYDRFGCRLHYRCRLHYHRRERRKVRAKTGCPEEEFGDDGLQFGPTSGRWR